MKFKNKLFKLITINFLVLSLIFLILELIIKYSFPQNLHGYMGQNIEGVRFLKKNVVHHHRHGDFYAKYQFGNFHNREYSTTLNNFDKDNNIMILGDSFTFGWLLNDEDTYIYKMQKKYSSIYFINMSYPGWGLADFTKAIELKCQEYKPKKIIIHLNTDDFNRARVSQAYEYDYKNLQLKKNKFDKITNNQDITKLKLLEKIDLLFINDGSVSIEEKKALLTSFKVYQYLIKNSHAFILIRNILYNFFFNKKKNNSQLVNNNLDDNFKFKIWPSPIYNLTEEQKKDALTIGKLHILKMVNLAKKCNTEIYFIFIGWVDFEKMSDPNNPTYLFFKNHKNFFVENSLNFFDNSKNLDVVQKNYEKYLIEGDLHPNPFGSNLLFKTLDKFYSQIIK